MVLFGGAAGLGALAGKKLPPHLIEHERRRVARVQEHASERRWSHLVEHPHSIRASTLRREELMSLVSGSGMNIPNQYTVSRFVNEWLDHFHQFSSPFDHALNRWLQSDAPAEKPFKNISVQALVAFMRLHCDVPHYTPYQLLHALWMTMPTHNDTIHFFEKRDWPGEEPMSPQEKQSLSLWKRLSEQEGGFEVIREIRLLGNKRD